MEEGKIEQQPIKKGPLITVMLLGAFVAVLNETLMNVALPELMEQLQITASTAQWLTTAYLLVIGILIPVSAFLIQRFTTRTLYFLAMSLFIAGTLLAGIAPGFSILLVGRVIQAAGTAILLPLMTNVILAIIPPEKRGSVMGNLGIVILFAPAVGPTLSGIIVEHYSWRILFFSILPIALLTIVYAYYTLRNVTETTKPRIDVLSIILSTLGFGGIVYGFSSAGESQGDLLSLSIFLPLLIGIVGLGLFIWRQLTMTEPMLDLRAFRYERFSMALVIIVIVMMAMFSIMILLPMFLQNARGFSPLEAGLLLLPGGVVMGIMSPITGRLFDRYGAKWLAIIGLGLMVIMLSLFSTISPTTPYWLLVVFHTLLVMGISLIMMPVMTMGLNQLPPKLYAHGTAIMNTMQQVSGAIGTALLITVMSLRSEQILQGEAHTSIGLVQKQILALTEGINASFALATGLVVIAFIFSFFLKSKQPMKANTQ